MYRFYFYFGLIILIGCTNNNQSTRESKQPSILKNNTSKYLGQWKLVRKALILRNEIKADLDANNDSIYKYINETSIWTFKLNNWCSSPKNYHIEGDSLFNSNGDQSQQITLKNDTMTIKTHIKDNDYDIEGYIRSNIKQEVIDSIIKI
ncbi:hypothetical protein K6119_11360 [Paracrocinitomix mangrovi]|uniref:hypothetical protein n=1 Tax=Paracrocinitomix mangrovi TaxID=2862509 RepID=UPI001C8DEEA1|nr:hypothetical protein [Paracrocinitomix mangrovi]UKN00332.1 hypothetical protein K6119_11360 [Paracrocinitomix mangrovi]